MKNGKVSQSVLKRSVLKPLGSKNEKVLTGPGPGIDYSSVCLGTAEAGQVITAIETSALEVGGQAARVVQSALNNVAVSGAFPVGILVSLCLPTLWNESQLRETMRDIDQACRKNGVQVMGGHTQASRKVKEAVLTVTGIGLLEAGERKISSGAAEPGMDILLTKWIALEGTGLIAAEKEDVLKERFAQPFIDQAKAFSTLHSILPEAAAAAKAGAAAMHDVEEGGIFGALWEMAESAGIGLEIDLKKIPVRQETIEITELFDVNPYKLLSGGSLLIAAKDGNQVQRELEKAGIPAVIIGKATDSNDRVLLHDGERRFLETVQTDEIWHVFAD